MSIIAAIRAMRGRNIAMIAIVMAVPAVLGGLALAAQDRYALKVPNGLAFSDFRGYDTWQPVAVSQTEKGMKLIAANDAMINAYRGGIPGNGKLFPNGSKIVKIEWTFKKNAQSPYFVNIPDTLKSISFIEKDSEKFPGTHGWAYAQFEYDAGSETLKPSVQGAECGYACHSKVAAQDYTYTAYPKR
jgi:hypothetical protein